VPARPLFGFRRGLARRDVDLDPTVSCVHCHHVAWVELPGQHHVREPGFDQALDRAAQRAGPELGVEALLCQQRDRRVGEHRLDALRPEAAANAVEQESDDLVELLALEGTKDDDLDPFRNSGRTWREARSR
jgi:hypothetical protein